MAGMCNYGTTSGADPTYSTSEQGLFHLTHYKWGSGNTEFPYMGSPNRIIITMNIGLIVITGMGDFLVELHLEIHINQLYIQEYLLPYAEYMEMMLIVNYVLK